MLYESSTKNRKMYIMNNTMTGEDFLLWLCRDNVSEYLLQGFDDVKSVFDIAREYGCTRLLVVCDERIPASVASANLIKDEAQRRQTGLAAENFVRIDVQTLGDELAKRKGSVFYVVPDGLPLPQALVATPKYYCLANEMQPIPAGSLDDKLGEHIGTPAWTKYFLLGRHSAEKQLEHARTILSNKGKPGVPQYVLITGETGTGKSFITRNLQKICRSEYNDKSRGFTEATPEEWQAGDYGYLQGNCASLSPQLADALLFGAVKGAYTGLNSDKDGLIESAGEGILFLDEVGDMPLETQGKLLTALEEKVYYRLGDTGKKRKLCKVECRIIFGTNRDLAAAAKEWEDSHGERGFRKDLLFRINSCHIELPPLRERLGEANSETRTVVFNGIVEQYCASYGLTLTRGAYEFFEQFAYSYCWPGNFRDVKRLFEHLKVGLMEEEIGDVVSVHAMQTALAELFGNTAGASLHATNPPSLAEQLKAKAPPREHSQIDRMLNACMEARSCASAGRMFYENERKSNYSDSFRKLLARWDLAFDVNAPGHVKPAPVNRSNNNDAE